MPSANVKKLPTLELLIDSYSVSLKDTDLAANQLLFDVPLSHVRDACNSSARHEIVTERNGYETKPVGNKTDL